MKDNIKKIHPKREYKYEKGIKIWTGKWLCNKCYSNDYNKRWWDEIKNKVTDTRTGNLNTNSSQAKGNKFEKLSEIIFGLDNQNERLDIYNTSIDHVKKNGELKYRTKGAFYDPVNKRWSFNTGRDMYKEFYIKLYQRVLNRE